MKDWQERVLNEHIALSTRLTALASFISRRDPQFLALAPRDQQLMKLQRDAMLEYEDILSERLSRFMEVGAPSGSVSVAEQENLSYNLENWTTL